MKNKRVTDVEFAHAIANGEEAWHEHLLQLLIAEVDAAHIEAIAEEAERNAADIREQDDMDE